MNDVRGAIPRFTKIEDYTTFLVEYVFDENRDAIIHFFLPLEGFEVVGKDHAGKDMYKSRKDFENYWSNVFPGKLSDSAQAYFNATYPRISAEYIPEMQSWYMRCKSYGNNLGAKEFIEKYFEVLDSALDGFLPPITYS